ncbi:MAG: ABC transporter ATP-binding protein [Planctomycetota bacterium]|nr:ABC transporter ATP-binding protein [Planctomycetota bacterium]
MIDVKNLTKNYGRTLAVNDISFHIDAGSVVGFLGPNGAGKTTTLRILTCFMPATNGSATIAGYDVFSQSLQVRSRVGYMPENVPLYPEMRVREYLMFRAALRGMRRKRRSAAVDRAAQRCWLLKPENMMRRRIDQLSRGYRQRVGLADCLLHEPGVLVLDEPTIGLDPAQVREMRNLIRSLGENHTVILSSHILAEVEQVCNKLIIISGGRIVAQGTSGELRRQVSGPSRVIVELKGGQSEQMAETVAGIEGVLDVQHERAGNWTRLTVQCAEETDLRQDVAALVAAKGYQLRELRREIGSLEDFFVQMTYEQITRD